MYSFSCLKHRLSTNVNVAFRRNGAINCLLERIRLRINNDHNNSNGCLIRIFVYAPGQH